MVLRFGWNTDVIKALKGTYPAQPKANGDNQQQHATDQHQAQGVRGIRVQTGAKNDADHSRSHHQSHAQAAHHRQAIERKLARLSSRAATMFFCHSIIAFCVLHFVACTNFAFCPIIRQA